MSTLAYSGFITTGTEVSAGSPFVFTDKRSVPSMVTQSNGTFTVRMAGTYLVLFNESGSAGVAGTIIPTMAVNGTDSTFGLAVTASSGATDFESVGFTYPLYVVASPNSLVTFQIVNRGTADADVTASQVQVIRL